MYKQIITIFLLLGLQLMAHEAEPACTGPATEISFPRYVGGFQVDGSWVFLRPIATDGELEYGSFITLTGNPPNLNALLLEVEPPHRSGYDLSIGGFFPNMNQSLHARFFSLHASGSDSKSIKSSNQIIQNFLGSSYSHSKARSKQKVDQAVLSYRFDTVIDQVLNVNFVLGLTYANIRRDFKVNFEDLVLTNPPSFLSGLGKSRYWGVGPLLGMQFSFPLFYNFGISGQLETGVLFGETDSRLTSKSIGIARDGSFSSKKTLHPAVTNLNTDLALTYSQTIASGWDFGVKAGYQVRYYFKPINRVFPFNGYVNNPNTFPKDTTSNLGLGGPYLLLSLSYGLTPSSFRTASCTRLPDLWASIGPSFEFTSFWLEPRPTNDDLVFASLVKPSGSRKDLETDPSTSWAGKYDLSFRFAQSLDLSLSALFFYSSDKDNFSTGTGERIRSINASGPTDVVFSEAKSRVQYKSNQYDGLIGKSIQFFKYLNLHGAVGLRYLDQDRTLTNAYLEGFPPITTQRKFPILKSYFWGIGPLFSFTPLFGPFWGFELTGNLGLAFLVGESEATFDQDNFGLVGPSSNDMRTPDTSFIAPAFQGSGALRWSYDFSNFNVGVEGGYQYLAYYRTVRLLLPTLLTGLEQINSNLILQGPYVRGQISVKF